MVSGLNFVSIDGSYGRVRDESLIQLIDGAAKQNLSNILSLCVGSLIT